MVHTIRVACFESPGPDPDMLCHAEQWWTSLRLRLALTAGALTAVLAFMWLPWAWYLGGKHGAKFLGLFSVLPYGLAGATHFSLGASSRRRARVRFIGATALSSGIAVAFGGLVEPGPPAVFLGTLVTVVAAAPILRLLAAAFVVRGCPSHDGPDWALSGAYGLLVVVAAVAVTPFLATPFMLAQIPTLFIALVGAGGLVAALHRRHRRLAWLERVTSGLEIDYRFERPPMWHGERSVWPLFRGDRAGPMIVRRPAQGGYRTSGRWRPVCIAATVPHGCWRLWLCEATSFALRAAKAPLIGAAFIALVQSCLSV